MKAKSWILIAVTAMLAAACLFFYAHSSHVHKVEAEIASEFTGYDDIISFVVEGYDCGWDGVSPEDMSLSQVYNYCSPCSGFAKMDINGDGTDELLMGDVYEDGSYQLYDICTCDRRTGDVVRLFSGGERDWCAISAKGIVSEHGSSSASDSFDKYYQIRGLKMKEIRDKAVEDDLMQVSFTRFADYAYRDICGGYTSQRVVTPEDQALFDATVENASEYSLTSVATQVVNGTNYRFLCKSNGERCWVTIYRPLNGEPSVTEIRK